MYNTFHTYIPTRVQFGPGQLDNLHRQKLPGKKAMVLIMISRAFAEFFIEKHACDDRFVEMARMLGMENASRPEDFITALVALQEACGVADLKMSDYGITREELPTLARNARETMGGLFAANPCEMTHEDCIAIFERAYR